MARKTIHKMPQLMPSAPIRYSTSTPPSKKKTNYWLLFLGLLLVGIYWFIFQGPTFAITSVEVTGSDNQGIKDVTNKLVGKNIFLVRQPVIENDMRQVYPPVATVELVRGLPHTVRFTVKLRDPVLKWSSGDKIYILDLAGEVFQEGDSPDYAALPLVRDSSQVQLEIGQQVISPAFIQFVTELHQQSSEMVKRKFQWGEVGETTFHVDALLEGDMRLKLTTQRPLKEQLEAANAILGAHPEAKLVDVRVAGWGYWK